MAGRLIGEAYISILADSDLFRASATAGMNKALAGVRGSIPITANTKDAQAQIAALATALKGLNHSADIQLNTGSALRQLGDLEAVIVGIWDRLDDIPVDMNDSRGKAKLLGLMGNADALAKQLENMDADGDVTKLASKIFSLDADAKELSASLSHIDADLNIGVAEDKINMLVGGAAKLTEELDSLRATVNDSAGESKIIAMQASAMKLAKELQNMPLTADTLPMEGALAKLAAQVEAFKKSLGGEDLGLNPVDLANSELALEKMGDGVKELGQFYSRTGDEGSKAFGSVNTAIKNVQDRINVLQARGIITPDDVSEVKSLNSDLQSLGQSTGMIGNDANNAARGFGVLGRAIALIQNTHIPLFGGALEAIHLPNFLASASGIHLLVEGVIELTAVWGPMLIGLSAFAALAITTAKDIYQQWTNMNTVMSATGAQFKGMTGGVNALEKAIQPQVMQLFGDYLEVAGSQGSHFQTVMVSIGHVLDDFGAKIATDLSSNKTSQFLSKASSDLAGVGDAFEQIGRIIGSLLKAVPGYAAMLLKLGDAFLTLTANAVQGLEPVIAVFLKLHGAIFYLGLATTAVLTFGRSFAAAAIAKGAEGLSASFSGMALSANNWARDFTSDNEKVAAEAGNSGSKLSIWAQGIGGLFGGLINSGVKFGATMTDIFKILNGSASVSGLSGGINVLEGGMHDLAMQGKVTTEGMDVLATALGNLKGASTDAAGIEVLSGAIDKLRTSSEDGAGLNVLEDALGGVSGRGIGRDAEEAGSGLGKFSQVLTKVPGFSNDAEKGISLFGTALTDLPLGPIGVAVGALAIGVGVGLWFAFHHTADAADQLNTKLLKLVDNSNLQDVQQNIATAIGQTTQALGKETAAVAKLNYTYSVYGGGTVVKATREQIGSYAQAGSMIQEYQQHLQSFEDLSITVAGRTNDLTTQFGSLSGAAEIMTLAGVKQNAVVKDNAQQWQNDQEKIQATAKAYGFMNQAGSTAAANLAVLNIATGNATKAVQNLTQAQQAWVTLITGGDSSFTGFEQGMATLSSDMKSGSKSGTALTVTVGKLTEKIPLLGTSLNGTSQSALAARQAFDSQLQAGITLYGNLEQLSAASGTTHKSQGLVAQGAKAIVAQLVPMAAGSKEATAELYGMAKAMGYIGPDNLKSIAKWAGSAKTAEDKLNDSQTKLTISSANLTQAAKNLGNSIVNDVTQMEAAKVTTAQLQPAINGLFNAFKSGHGFVNQAAVTMGGEYVQALKNSGVGTTQATQMLNAYLKSLGYTPGAIAAIDSQLGDSTKQWNSYDKQVKSNTVSSKAMSTATKDNASAFSSLDPVLAGSVGQLGKVWEATVKQDSAMVQSGHDTAGAKNQFVDFANNGLGITTAKADELWKKFGDQNLTWLSGHAASTKSAFLDLAENSLHLTTLQAQTLWGEFAQQNLDMLVTKGDNAKNKFIDLAKNGLDLTNSQANTLWTTLRNQYLDTVANKAGETRQAFEKTASQFNLTTGQADTLWRKLKTLSGGSPYNVAVNEHLSGNGKITAAISATAVSISSPGAGSDAGAIGASNSVLKAAGSIGHRAGWQVPAGGGPSGQDSHLAVLAPGELVIPTSHAAKFGEQAKQAGVPGFAAGGGFPNAAGVGATAQAGVPTMQNAAEKFTAEAMGQFVQDLKQQQTADANAAAFGGASGGETANATAAMKYLAANLFGGNLRAAAGAIASIFGESSWNPESVGTGGFGLIGWTGNTLGLPAGYHGPTGNATRDFDIQLPGIIGFVKASGDLGVIAEMKSAASAGASIASLAEMWGKGVERYGIDDVHAFGVNEAQAILSSLQANKTPTTASVAAGSNAIAKAGQKPHSGGGMVSEPVYGTGAYSGMSYSFAENGTPEYVGPLSGGLGPSNPGMPGATQYGQATTNQLLMSILNAVQRQPQTIGKSIATAGGNGMAHGYFKAQN